ncbi:MAG: Clp protease N-terminal domain-containing protein [Acidovorax sp.]|nr:Clp protease N-terminal domain-containing protein [Acidovorax sp.]
MLGTLKNKFKDAGTLSALCKEAERIARFQGNEAPGSEHFVLASLSLEDGTARRALASLGATPKAFEEAMRAQFVEALRHAGMEAAPDASPDLARSPRVPNASKLYRAAPSGQTIVQRLASTAETREARSLLAADVLLAAAEEEFSIAARALRVLGITPEQLVQAARQEITLHEQGPGKA